MRTRWITLLLAFGVSVTLAGQQYSYKKTSADVTVAGTAIALFSSTDVSGNAGHPAATVGVCALSTANIRVSYDGTDPTASLGVLLTPGIYTITGTDVMLAMKGIRSTSTSATWSCVVQGQ